VSDQLKIVAIVATLALLVAVFELVRQRRLMERYALLWLASAGVLAALAIWSALLGKVAAALGIATPSNALFLIAFGFVLLLLLHFSLIISTLTGRSAVLAQEVGMLKQEIREIRDSTEDAPPFARQPNSSTAPATRAR
jgi:hypothetical protein